MECVRERPVSLLCDLGLEIATSGDTARVGCRGRILHGVTARYLRASVARLILRHRHVVLDLSGVTHLDACGVGTLAALVRLSRGPRGGLVLAAPAGRVKRLLQVARLDTQVGFVTLETW